MTAIHCYRRLLVQAVACAALTAASGMASAADLPPDYFNGRTLKIIVPYPAGGSPDILARLLAPKLSEALGPNVVVENKPGATGNLGADFVAKAPADGLTVLLADIGSLAIAPGVLPALPFDPVKDFAPVIMVACRR